MTTIEKRPRGRPRVAEITTGRPIYTPEQGLALSRNALRAEYEAMSPAQQSRKRAHVEQLLARERRSNRREPSPFARIAPDVYGIALCEEL